MKEENREISLNGARMGLGVHLIMDRRWNYKASKSASHHHLHCCCETWEPPPTIYNEFLESAGSSKRKIRMKEKRINGQFLVLLKNDERSFYIFAEKNDIVIVSRGLLGSLNSLTLRLFLVYYQVRGSTITWHQ